MLLGLFVSSVMMLRGLTRALQLTSPPSQGLSTNFVTSALLQDAVRETIVPKIGIMDNEDGLYTSSESGFPELPFQFKPQTSSQLFQSRFGLWRQAPWKKIKGKVIIRAKFGGSLPLESAAESVTSLFATKDTLSLQTFNEFTSLCILGAYDPRIKAIFLELSPLACGYAKIDEMIRLLNLFRASGKPVVGYATGAGMKEYYLSRAFDEFYLPPEGQLTLQGFASQSTFVRGALEKIGVEPEVRFIGKYKSFGESLVRKNMSEAQRESTSLILNELSDRWAAKVAASLNKTHDEVTKLWTEVDSLSPYDFKERGFITGVMYKDQVEKKLQDQLTTSKPRSIFNRIVNFFLTNKDSDSTSEANQSTDYDLQKDFESQPRRQLKNLTAEELKAMQNETKVAQKNEAKAAKMKDSPNFFPVQTYLSKMKKGFRILQGLPVNFGTKSGPRVAVINAFGGISQGKSGNSPTGGRSVGADSIVELIKKARLDRGIKAVVLRVDSPGGDALASDLVWRELRALSKEKPVVASMVDTAASGGYYFSMACDQIVAEQATLTGSIGVVLAALKWPELNKKLNVTSEVLSIGRYPSILLPDKAFTPEEEQYFDAQAKQAYLDFTTKAAASRSMPLDTLQEVAQGRVWFGRQAMKRGLVDHLGGLWTAVDIAYDLAHMKPNATENSSKTFKYNVEILQDRSAGAFAAALSGASSNSEIWATNGRVMALASDEVFNMNLVSEESLGGSRVLSQLGLNAQWTMLLKSSPEARPFFQWLEQGEKLGGVRNLWNMVVHKLGL